MFIVISNTFCSCVNSSPSIHHDVKLDDNKFEVLMCDIKNKWDILKAVYNLKRKDMSEIKNFTYFKTNKIKLEFDEVPPSWCIDGDELVNEQKTFEITINKDNNMLLPTKNIEKLFEKNEEETFSEN